MRRSALIGLFALIALPSCGGDDTAATTGGTDAAAAGDVSAQHVCTPGLSVACVGPGGCSGGQACKSDGSGYEPCNCGSQAPDASVALPDASMTADVSTTADVGATETGDAASTVEDVASEPEAAVLGSADIQILGLSDFLGQVDPILETDSNLLTQQYGGLGVLSTYFKADAAKNPNTMITASGGEFGATPTLSVLFDDEPAVKGLNFLGLTVDTLGNHDFDHGTTKLKDVLQKATYKVVSSNLSNVAAELGTGPVVPFHMISIGQTDPKVKVAFLGITNPDAPQLLFPGRLGTITVNPSVAAANTAAAAARAAGANVVVALAHLGATSVDVGGTPTGPLADFANGVQGVDVVLGAQTGLVVNKTVNGVLVVENRSKGRTYARVALSVVKGAVISKTATVVDPIGLGHALTVGCESASNCACAVDTCPTGYTCNLTPHQCEKNWVDPDPAAATLLQPYRDQLVTKFDQKIGTTTGLFARDATQAERLQEVAIGDLVADAALSKYAPLGAQIAFIDGGSIRTPLPSGYLPVSTALHRPTVGYDNTLPWDLLVGDVYNALPFGNACVVRKITGSLLWSLLEKSVFTEPLKFGGFLQIAGFKYSYRVSNPAGARVTSVTLLAGNLDIPSNDTTEYTMVTNDFVNSGGNGYSLLIETSPSPSRDIWADVLVDYVKANTPLTPATSGRITQTP